MNSKLKKLLYIPTFGEEVANTVSHGVMAVLALLALPFSAVWAYLHGAENPALASAGVAVFMLCIFMMLLCSTLYHAMQPDSKHKAVFHILDHIMIYLAIAGSYTPIALYVIGGWQGTLIVVIQWVMVPFGIFYKSLARRSIPSISLSIYLIMGWMIVIFFPLFWKSASTPLLALIGAGGIFYTLGAYFYAKKGFRYHHLVWHLLINLATLCHAVGIVFFLY